MNNRGASFVAPPDMSTAAPMQPPPSASRSLSLALQAVAAALVLLAAAAPARADDVDRLVTELDAAGDYKVRLSAAASLAKLADPRAIPAFVKALGKRGEDKTVRAAAAVGLGKIVTSETPAALRAQAVDALRTAAGDANAFVKKQAAKALARLEALPAPAAPAVAGAAARGIYVDVGQMSAQPEGAAALKAVMRKATLKALGKGGAGWTTEWTGGKAPAQAELDRAGLRGFHVDGTLTTLTSRPKGADTVVSCKLSMYVATFPEKSAFGFLEGGASVLSATDPKEIELARQDCVTAVLEDLMGNKVVPAIRAKAAPEEPEEPAKPAGKTRPSKAGKPGTSGK